MNLAIFNFLPAPPLDGSKILLALLSSPRHARLRYMLETQGPFILILLILIDSVAGLGIFASLFQFIGTGFFRLLGIAL